MIHLTVTGNLGMDAELRNDNKKIFFTVASSDGGRTHWINCFLNFGENTKALDLLKKGARCIVQGYVFQTFYEHESQKIPSLSINVSYYEIVKQS
ncbi:MAG: single-stranded DNA-binding protein [Bacteroidales bacterium]|jgi:single-stranded DNA-binding protein|nr:single-stranded DNA-binding protein [Bacteroidales bacterium]